MLLRYPVPELPHGPPSFVKDAVYLQRHVSAEGGKSIIARYTSDFTSKSKSSTGSKRGKRVPQQGRDHARSSLSPGTSPSKFLQDQGGIEGIIQEAARGVYNRSEKWGVAKALRGAYQGLQSAGGTPTKLASAPRWALDSGGLVTDNSTNVTARIHALEQRNKALAKLLEKSMEDLWVQQREFTKEKAEIAADALSLAIAKVQFVQVYLENSTMPLPADDEARSAGDEVKALESLPTADFGTPIQALAAQPSPTPKPITHDIRKKNIKPARSSNSQNPDNSPSKKTESVSTSTDNIPQLNISSDGKAPEEVPQTRPILAQSSFSWILGEDQRKSDFVAASPFSTERERARGKAGFLFGDDKAERSKSKTAASEGKSATDRDAEEEEAINLRAMNAAVKDV